MRECHECGCNLPPGGAMRREVVVGRTNYDTHRGGATATHTAMVDVCARCAELIDRRPQLGGGPVGVFAIIALVLFVCAVAGGYFFIVKPQMDKHDREWEKAKREHEEFRRKHFGD